MAGFTIKPVFFAEGKPILNSGIECLYTLHPVNIYRPMETASLYTDIVQMNTTVKHCTITITKVEEEKAKDSS